MTAAELLEDLQLRGVFLRAEGLRLVVEAPRGVLTTELRAQVADHKPALLGLLADPAQWLVITDVPPEVAARGLSVQMALDRAFAGLPPRLQDVPAVEAAPFWAEDTAELRRLQDAADWPGLLAALDRHLVRGLAFYRQLQQEGGAV